MASRPLPSTDNLRCFVAVAEHLNFRRAAAEVSLTPGALSQRIKQLEDQLDCKLFNRSPRHVELTEAGRRFITRAAAALQALEACTEIDNDEPAPVRFSLGTRFELGLSWIMPAILELGTTRPLWTIDLVFGSGDEILSKLERGQVDSIVTSAPAADESWQARVLHGETYVLVAAPELLADKPFDAPEDAAAHRLLDLNRSLPLSRYAQPVGPSLPFADVWFGGTTAALRAMLLAGRGVAVVPEYLVRDDLSSDRLRQLLPDVELLSDTFRLLFRTASPLAPTLGELANELRARPLT